MKTNVACHTKFRNGSFDIFTPYPKTNSKPKKKQQPKKTFDIKKAKNIVVDATENWSGKYQTTLQWESISFANSVCFHSKTEFENGNDYSFEIVLFYKPSLYQFQVPRVPDAINL